MARQTHLPERNEGNEMKREQTQIMVQHYHH